MRKARGLSQEELADLADLDRSQMGHVERGETNVALLGIIRIAAALGVTVTELMEAAKL